MKRSNDLYDFLKWVSLLAVPTVTLITSISDTLGYIHGAEIAAIVSAIGVFAGTVIKISTDAYNASNNND
jgi:hypothetical protein